MAEILDTYETRTFIYNPALRSELYRLGVAHCSGTFLPYLPSAAWQRPREIYVILSLSFTCKNSRCLRIRVIITAIIDV